MKSVPSLLIMATLLTLASSAMAEILVVVNPRSPLTRLEPEQVSQLFLGKTTEMPGVGPVTTYDLPEDSPLRERFYNQISQRTVNQMKAYWARQVFTGKGRPPRQMRDNQEVKRSVAALSGGIGYIDKSALDDTVKVVLTLD